MNADFASFVKQPIPRGRFAEYASAVRSSSGNYFVLDPGKLEHGYHYSDLLQAYRNAPLYRQAILDESLPATMEDASRMLLDESPFFCRHFWIVDLGRIRCTSACPELREVMLHDLRPDLRAVAAESLGKVGDHRYTRDLIHVMREDKQVGYAALKALGDMADAAAFPALRERFEEERRKFELAMQAGGRDMSGNDVLWDQVMAISSITEIMTRAGGKAKEFIKNWGRYEFYDWVRRPMKSGSEWATI